MARLTFDLGDLYQDTKQMLSEFIMFLREPKEAPPVVRNIKSAHWILKDNNDNPVGSFAPELYELALVRGLIAQQEEDAFNAATPDATLAQKQNQSFYSSLYHADGTAKTAFELSVLPVIYSDYNNDSIEKIRAYIKPELVNRVQNGQPLPPLEYKYITKSDYLKNIGLINLKAVAPRDVTVDVENPAEKTTRRERAFHYIAQRASLVLTLLMVAALTASTPAWFMVAAMGVLLAEWCGKEFGTFGTAETLLRDLSSLFLKDFRWGDKVSLKKTIKTGILLAAVGSVALTAITGAWAGVLALPLWNAGLTGFAANALTALQFGTAGFAASAGGLMTFVGLKDAIHFFWGLGIWDKQIDFSKEKQLPALTKEAELKEYNHVHEKNFVADCKFAGKALDAQQVAQLHGIYAQLDAFTDTVFAQPQVKAKASVTALKDVREANAKDKAKVAPKPDAKEQSKAKKRR